jgi:hypothetical protein
VDAAKQLEEAEERREQRHPVDGATCRREFQREGQEEQADVMERALVPRELRQPGHVDVPREEPIGLRRVAREQALELLSGEPVRVRVEKLPGATRSARERRRHAHNLRP